MRLRPRARTLTGWGIGAGVGAILGLVVGLPIGPGHGRETPPPPGDRARAAIWGVTHDPAKLYLAPEVRERFSAQGIEAARAEQVHHAVPAWVVILGPSGTPRADGAASNQQLLAQLEEALHYRHGLYVVASYSGEVATDGVGYDDPQLDPLTGRADSRLVSVELAVQSELAHRDKDWDEPYDQMGGAAAGALTGALAGAVGYAVIFGLVGSAGVMRWRVRAARARATRVEGKHA